MDSFVLINVCAPTISAALKSNVSACHCYISNTNLEKICHFPELRISQNNSFRVIFSQKICKNCTNISIKGPFKTMGEEK
jgi:hypothetical protein